MSCEFTASPAANEIKVFVVTEDLNLKAKTLWLYQAISESLLHTFKNVILIDQEHFKQLNGNPTEKDIVIFADAFFLGEQKELSDGFLSKIKSFKIWISFDDEYYMYWTIYFSRYMDLVITFDTVTEAYLNQLGMNVIICPHPVHLRDYLGESHYKYDVSFIGNISEIKPGRRRFLERISKDYRNCFFPGIDGIYVPADEMYEVFLRTKINISLSKISYFRLGFDPPLMSERRGFKGRPFEIGAAGGFCLTEFSPAIERFLLPNIDIVTFHDVEEALKKIDYYLEFEDERLSILRSLKTKVTNSFASNSSENLMLKTVVKAYESRNINSTFTTGYEKQDIFLESLELTRFLYQVRYGKLRRAVKSYLGFWRAGWYTCTQLHRLLLVSMTSFFVRKIMSIFNLKRRER